MKDLITIGLPSKGRLKDKAISFFEGNNFQINITVGQIQGKWCKK